MGERYPCSRFKRLTSMVRRWRKTAMKSASPHRGFGGGHRHHEEDDQLTGVVVPLARIGDQRQVAGVEHQLDREEDADAVAPGQRADGADAEQHRRQQEIPGDGDAAHQ
jgi:hypothetical protein